MVELCKEVFTAVLGDRPNQLDKKREDVHVTAEQLLDVKATPGEVTEDGLRNNISVGIQYLESWLRGSGAVGINNLMEDAATAEISRSQVWQWLHNGVRLSGGETVTRELVERLTDEEMGKIRQARGDAYASGRWDDARALFTEMALADEYPDFLTLPAYQRMP
jgi:malate synthase